MTTTETTRTQDIRVSLDNGEVQLREDYRLRRSLVEDWADVLNALPGEPHIQPYSFQLGVFYVVDDGQAETTRGAIQSLLGIPATRSTDKDTGQTSYVFKQDKLFVHITGGKLAHGCELVPYEAKVTRFKVVCHEAAQAAESRLAYEREQALDEEKYQED